MTDKTNDKSPRVDSVNRNRRRALLGSVTGVTAAVWHKPIISVVMLPAHAQMSVIAPKNFFGAAVAAMPVVMNKSPLDLLLSPAFAGAELSFSDQYTISVEQTDTEGNIFQVGVFEHFEPASGPDSAVELIYQGSVSTSAGGTLAVAENPCNYAAQPIVVDKVTVNAASIVLSFSSRGQMVELPAGEGALPMPMCTAAPLKKYFAMDLAAMSVTRNKSLMDLLVSPAYAGISAALSSTYTITVEQTDSANETFQVGVFENIETTGGPFSTVQITYQGQVTKSGGGTLAVAQNPCDYQAQPISVSDVATDSNSISLNFSSRGQTLQVPEAEGVLPVPMCTAAPLPNNFSKINVPLPRTIGAQSEPGFSPLDLLVPTAQAQIQEPLASMTAVLSTPGRYTVTFQDQSSARRWTGDLSDDGTVASLDGISQCNEFGDVDARIDSVTATEMLLSVDLDGFIQFTLDPVLLPLPEICMEV